MTYIISYSYNINGFELLYIPAYDLNVERGFKPWPPWMILESTSGDGDDLESSRLSLLVIMKHVALLRQFSCILSL